MLTLRDIAADGKLLLTIEARRLEMAGRIAGDSGERALSLTDSSRVQQLSADGSLLLFEPRVIDDDIHVTQVLALMG